MRSRVCLCHLYRDHAGKTLHALTTAIHRTLLVRRRLRSDWKSGSAFEMVRSDGTVSDAGKVVEYDPPRRLAYTFVNLSDKYRNEFPALATFRARAPTASSSTDAEHEVLARQQNVAGVRGLARDPFPASRASWKPGSLWKSPMPPRNGLIDEHRQILDPTPFTRSTSPPRPKKCAGADDGRVHGNISSASPWSGSESRRIVHRARERWFDPYRRRMLAYDRAKIVVTWNVNWPGLVEKLARRS